MKKEANEKNEKAFKKFVERVVKGYRILPAVDSDRDAKIRKACILFLLSVYDMPIADIHCCAQILDSCLFVLDSHFDEKVAVSEKFEFISQKS